jgi:hypothetical protein
LSIFVDRSEVVEFLKQAKVTPKYSRGDGSEVAGKANSPSDTKSKDTVETTSSSEETKAADEEKAAAAKAAAAKVAANETGAAGKLRIAKKLLDTGAADDGRAKLQEVIDKYPSTKAAIEAKELLDKLKK